jgi:hypothetical protein
MKENMFITGRVKSTVREFISGLWIPIDTFDSGNQILNGMLDHTIKKIIGTTTDEITQLTFGTNITSASRTDTVAIMENTFTNNLIGSPSSSAYNKLKYMFELGPTEHNGYDIAEYALTLNTNEIVCRLTRGIVKKTINIRIDGTWELTINI